jgi:hypothetical protein
MQILGNYFFQRIEILTLLVMNHDVCTLPLLLHNCNISILKTRPIDNNCDLPSQATSQHQDMQISLLNLK